MRIKEKTQGQGWVISIQGQRAVDAGYKFQKNYCYRGLYDHGERIAQLEVVLDSEKVHNGLVQKWVDVTLYDWRHCDRVLRQLERLGFKGCLCMCYDELRDASQKDAVFFNM